MPEQPSDPQGVAGAFQNVTERASALVSLKGELLRREINRKTRSGFIGLGFGIAGGVFLVLAILVGLGAIVAGLSTAFEPWQSVLILFGGLLVFGVGFLIPGVIIIKRVGAPRPKQTIIETQATTSFLKGNGKDAAEN